MNEDIINKKFAEPTYITVDSKHKQNDNRSDYSILINGRNPFEKKQKQYQAEQNKNEYIMKDDGQENNSDNEYKCNNSLINKTYSDGKDILKAYRLEIDNTCNSNDDYLNFNPADYYKKKYKYLISKMEFDNYKGYEKNPSNFPFPQNIGIIDLGREDMPIQSSNFNFLN